MCRLPLDGGLPSGPANMTSCLQGATAKSPFRAQHYDDEFLQFQYKVRAAGEKGPGARE
jgi:hypothetical protein